MQDGNLLQQMWLQIFSNKKLCQFSYESFSKIEHQAFQPAIGVLYQTAVKQEFSCQFPFFWLIKEAIDVKLENAKNTAGIVCTKNSPLTLF